MSADAQLLLDTFDSLSDGDKLVVVAELLRRFAPPDYGPLSDETLVEIAEQQFLKLDADEAASAQP